MRRTSLIFGVCALLLSCDGALVDGLYQGEPIHTVQGIIARFDQKVPAFAVTSPKRVSLFWSPTGQTNVPVGQLVEQSTVSVAVEALSDFRLEIFHPPATELYVSQTPAYAIALLLVYADVDNDGRFSEASDLLLGGALDHVVVYAPQALDAESSFARLDIPAGFFTVQTPVTCVKPVDTEPVCAESDVPSDWGRRCDMEGAFCEEESICLSFGDDNAPGICGFPQALLACVPPGARAVDEIWMPGCVVDEDCASFSGTFCDIANGLCQPAEAPCAGTIVPGVSCARDEDCGSEAGLCLLGDPLSFVSYTNGYCVYDDAKLDCRPADGTLVIDVECDRAVDDSECFEVEVSRWYRACTSDDDCRGAEGYRCDPFINTCSVAAPLELVVDGGFSPEADMVPLCTDWD